MRKPAHGPSASSASGVEAGQHVEALEVLVIKNERDDEDARHHGEATAAVETGENHRQIVKAQERKLLLHEGVDGGHREHQQQHENPLEMAEEEELGALQETRLGHERPRA